MIYPRVRFTNLGQGQGKVGRYAVMGTLSPADVTEGSAMSNTAISHTAKDITCAQRGIKATILDIAAQASAFGLAGPVQNIIRQVTQDTDSKIAALFAAFTTNNVVGSTLTDTMVFQALGKVLSGTGNHAIASPDLTLAIHTAQYASLLNDLAANGNALNNTPIMQGVSQGNLPSIYGIQIAVTNQCPTAASSGYKSGALFYRDAIGVVSMWAAKPVTLHHPDGGGGPATIVSVTNAQGYAELVDAYATQIESD